MTIKTLEHIHRLLQDEYNRVDGAYQISRRSATVAEDNQADNADELNKLAMSLFHERQSARRALDEFEEHEFS